MFLLLLSVGCPKPPIPGVPGDPTTTGFVPPCCPIGEGPWSVQKGTFDANGNFLNPVDIGRVWATSEADDDLDSEPATLDWYEEIERKSASGVWTWMTSTTGWKATVGATGASAIKCDETGYLDCQEIEAYTSSLPAPSAELTTRPIYYKRQAPEVYHQPGKYKVTATFESSSPTKKYAWYFTKGGSWRTEVWCLPSGWSWPRRTGMGVDPVSWVMQWVEDAPQNLPATTGDCGNLPDGNSTEALRSDAIKL